MDQPTHIIDPDGEVIIVLRNSDSPFAELGKDMLANGFSYAPPEPSDDVQSPAKENEISKGYMEKPVETLRKNRKGKKSKKKGLNSLSATVHTPLEPTQPPIEEPATELPATGWSAIGWSATGWSATGWSATGWPATGWPATKWEELVTEVPVTEVPVTEVPVTEVPVTEVPVTEVPVVEEQTEEQTETDLVCGPLDESCFRIQVSAKHLILASSVFKKMLTGGWKESVTYLEKGSVEITEERWDIEALLIVLRAIHGQQYHIPRKLNLEMLAKVAVLADYYDCKEAVYIWTTIWVDALEEEIPKTYSRDLFLWLWISWAFQLPAQFKESTSTAMSWSNGWINSLGLPIPLEVMGAMNEYRQEAINNLIKLLHETREALLSGTRGC